MKSTLRALALSLLVCAAASAQNAALLPVVRPQFLDNNGAPLVGGYLYTCTAGTTCLPAFVGDPPVNPLATFTDSTGSVANANPIVLDSAGRAGVWLGSGTYKLVLQDANGVTQWSQDNVSSLSLKSVTTSSGAVSNFNVPGTLTVGSITASGTISGKLRDFLSVKDFGAKCDGSTDDSAALQAGINASMAAGKPLFIPGGTCAFGTTLTMNNVAAGSHLVGAGNMAGASILKYTGTGTALLYKNTIGNHYIYNAAIEGIAIEATNTATYGIEAYTLSESYFKDIQVNTVYSGATPTGTWQTGIYCGSLSASTGCNIVVFEHTIIEQTRSHAVQMVNPAAITFRDDDFFAIKGANFALNGSVTQFNIKDGWHEESDIGVLLDDSLSSDSLDVQGLVVDGARFLFDAPLGTGSFANQIVFRTNVSGSKYAEVRQIVFRDCAISFAFGLTTTAYPFQINWPVTTAPAPSLFRMDLSSLLLNGIQNTGAYVNVIGNSAANKNYIQLSFRNLFGVDQNNASFGTEVNGFASYQDINQVLDALNIGRNSSHSGLTLAVHDNDAANGGKTIMGLFSGANQGAFGLQYFYDGSGNPMYINDAFGVSYVGTTHGSRFLNANQTQRWYEIIQGTESGSNSGSNWTLNRYNDAGTFIDTPLTVNRQSGTVVIGNGGLSMGANAGLTITKNLKGSDGNNCNETFTGGILTASTCP